MALILLEHEVIVSRLAKLNEVVRRMGDGEFEPFHWAGESSLAGMLEQICGMDIVGSVVLHLANKAMVHHLTTEPPEIGSVEEMVTYAQGQADKIKQNGAGLLSMLMLVCYQLGRESTEKEPFVRAGDGEENREHH